MTALSTSTPQALLKTNQLTVRFAPSYQLGPVDLHLAAGETVGVVGRNGAGKSTLFQLLTGNLDASGGEVHVDGHRLTPDTPHIKRFIGYLPQDPVLPRWATGREVLAYAARLYELPDIAKRVPAAEAYWDCGSFRQKPLSTLSYGMQKRVALALATLHEPRLLILDEPFSGLDLNHIKALEELLTARGSKGLTTVLSTHVTAFCARLCSRVWSIQDGRLESIEPWQSLDQVPREQAIEARFFAAPAPLVRL